MRKVIKEDRRFWCHRCQKEVILMPKMSCDICPECSVELKPRMPQDFEEISDEEARRRWNEQLKADSDIPDRE